MNEKRINHQKKGNLNHKFFEYIHMQEGAEHRGEQPMLAQFSCFHVDSHINLLVPIKIFTMFDMLKIH